jgi:hypothetical protein
VPPGPFPFRTEIVETRLPESGHFASWFGESLNGPNSDVQHDTSTFNLQSTDGSHIVVHGRDHITVNANGVVTSTFSVQSVTCG